MHGFAFEVPDRLDRRLVCVNAVLKLRRLSRENDAMILALTPIAGEDDAVGAGRCEVDGTGFGTGRFRTGETRALYVYLVVLADLADQS
jgi:hypothetical protein